MTINVTVGQRRAGRRRTRPSPRSKTRPTRSAPPTSASPIPTTRPANAFSAVKITTLPAAGTLTLTTASRSPRASSCRVADITAGKLVFTPAANANGAGYASFTFQVQDDGGTANGGVDLDPTRQHDDDQRHLGQRRAGGRQQHGHHARGHAPTPSAPPTSASPIRTTARPTPARRSRSRRCRPPAR